MGERDHLISEIEFKNLFRGDPSAPAASDGLLSLSSRQYREYADEWKSSAQTAYSDAARELSLKMANIWLEAAMRCEAGLGTPFTERGEEAGTVPQASPDDSAVRIKEPQAKNSKLDDAAQLIAWIRAA
jgi:hypothetical protein